MILEELTMKEFRRGLRKTRTIIIPYGTIEAHGTHLPLNTDTLVITEAAKKVAERVPIFVAPPLHYGVCTSTGQHPGTLGITPETLRSITLDLVRDGYRKGLRRFILVSGHGGSIHVSSLREAAEVLTEELKGVSIAAFSIYEVLPEEARSIAETPNDSHAGEMETSLVMYLAPSLLKGSSREEYPKLPKPIIARDKVKYWPGAVWGDPSKASRDKGERFFNMMVDSLLGLVRRLDKVKP